MRFGRRENVAVLSESAKTRQIRKKIIHFEKEKALILKAINIFTTMLQNVNEMFLLSKEKIK